MEYVENIDYRVAFTDDATVFVLFLAVQFLYDKVLPSL